MRLWGLDQVLICGLFKFFWFLFVLMNGMRNVGGFPAKGVIGYEF